MLFAKKDNRVCRILEAEMDYYSDKGYTISDDKGTVLTKAVPSTIEGLKARYIEQEAEIASLKEEIASLQSEIDKLRKKTTVKKISAEEAKSDKVD